MTFYLLNFEAYYSHTDVCMT